MAEHSKRRKWLRRTAVIAASTLVLLALLYVVATWWIIPHIIRTRVQSSLAEYWQGEVEVGEVDFSFFGPIRLSRLRLQGPDQRQWLDVKDITLGLRDWPSLSPVLTEVRIDSIDLNGYFPRGDLDLPVETPPPKEGPPTDPWQYVDLQNVRVNRITASVAAGEAGQIDLPGMRLEMTPQGDRMRLTLRLIGMPDAAPLAEGSLALRQTQGDLRLQMEGRLTREQGQVLMALAQRPGLSLSGTFNADVTIDGDPTDLATLRANGRVQLSDWELAGLGRQLLESAGATAVLEGRRVEIRDLTAQTPTGSVEGRLYAEAPLDSPPRFGGTLRARRASLEAAAQLLPALPVRGGVISLAVEFDGQPETIHAVVAGSLDARMTLAELESASGSFGADVTFRDWMDGPEAMSILGSGMLLHWRLRGPEAVLARNLSAVAGFDGRQIDLTWLTADVAGGTLTASGDMALPGDDPLRADLQVTASSIEAEEIVALLPAGAGLPATGRLDLQARLSVQGLDTLRARGIASVVSAAAGPVSEANASVAFDVAAHDALEGPEAMRLDGWVKVNDASARDEAGMLAQNVDALLLLAGQDVWLAGLRADTAGGTVVAAGHVELPLGRPLRYSGGLALPEPVALGPLAERFGLEIIESGQASLTAGFRGEGLDRVELMGSADGQVQLQGLPVASGAGALQYSLTATDLTGGADALGVRGTASLSGGHVETAEGLEVTQLAAEAQFSRRQVTLKSFSGRTPGGPFEGDLQLTLPTDKEPLAYSGHLGSEGLDVLALLQKQVPGLSLKQIHSGRLAFTSAFSGRGLEQVKLQLEGSADAEAAEGKLASGGRLKIDSEAENLDAPLEEMTIQGKATMSNWRIATPEATLLRDLGLAVDFDGRTITLRDLAARTAEGRLAGNGSLNLAAEGGPAYEGTLDITGLDLQPLTVLLEPLSWMTGGRLELHTTFQGTATQKLKADLRGSVAMQLAAEQIESASGNYQLDITMDGPFTEMDHLRAKGTGRLEQWTIEGAGGTLAHDVAFGILLLGRSVDFTGLRGRLADGRLAGHARLDAPVGEPIAYRGGVRGEGIEFKTLVKALGNESEGVRGQAEGAYGFRGTISGGLEGLHGRGAVAIRDVLNWRPPLLDAIVSNVGLADPGQTDVDLSFRNEGLMVTVEDGRVATPVLAIAIQKGSTVNLDTRYMDLYVVVALLGRLENALGGIPILGGAGDLLQQLSRLRVTGYFDERSSIKVSKQPLKDIAGGTKSFLEGVAETGGDLGQAVGQTLTDLLP